MPEPAIGVESVLRPQKPSVARDQVDGVHNVLKRVFGDEVVEAGPDPAGFDSLAAGDNLALEAERAVEVDAEQPMPVWAGAGAAWVSVTMPVTLEAAENEPILGGRSR